jgi:uncharacterized membrane protein YphA (DoxX/SURF4 family)
MSIDNKSQQIQYFSIFEPNFRKGILMMSDYPTAFEQFRQTGQHKHIFVIRLIVGGMFLLFGVIKYTSPDFWANWNAMLTLSGVPAAGLLLWLGPLFEIVTGMMLLLGWYTRLGGLGIVAFMLGALYVHVVVDPTKLPAGLPPLVLPILVLLAGLYVAWRGGGWWSIDGRAFTRLTREAHRGDSTEFASR